jgi:integrase
MNAEARELLFSCHRRCLTPSDAHKDNMRRRGFQKPKIRNVNGYLIAQYRDLAGVKRKVSLGPAKTTRKRDAEEELAKILAPINGRRGGPTPDMKFGQFIRSVYLPFYSRKWKGSTTETNEDRIRHHLISEYEDRPLASFNRSRDELQEFLDRKAIAGLSYSTVAHLRWDLRQIFRMAASEQYLARNPAELLFIPRNAPRNETRRMTVDEVRDFLVVLELRERVIGGLAVLAGMRPGEIFALTRGKAESEYANIQQRVYRGEIDTPKTFKSRRMAALGDGLMTWIRQWLEVLPDGAPDGWMFPSERGATPLAKDNVWRRHFLPRLKEVGLDWVNFQVLRRTHSSLEDDLGVDPQVRATQMGHGVDVNQNDYTKASLQRRKDAVNALEKMIGLPVM